MNNFILWLVIILWIIIPLIIASGSTRKLFIGLRTPTTWISALPGKGWVEVLGKVSGEPLKSLLNKSDCGYWQLEVQEYQNSGRGGGHWRTIYRQSSGNFTLDDMTGRIQVQDGKVKLLTSNETLMDNSDPSINQFLAGLGIKTSGLLGFKKRLRVYERVVAPDEELLVLGKLQKSSAPITIVGNDIQPLVISSQGRAETNKSLMWQAGKPLLIGYLVGLATLVFIWFSLTA
jgi:hypothetical protein